MGRRHPRTVPFRKAAPGEADSGVAQATSFQMITILDDRLHPRLPTRSVPKLRNFYHSHKWGGRTIIVTEVGEAHHEVSLDRWTSHGRRAPGRLRPGVPGRFGRCRGR